jgi:hypothetical protein
MHKHHSESENSNYLKKIFHRELLVDVTTYPKSNKNKIKNSPIARGTFTTRDTLLSISPPFCPILWGIVGSNLGDECFGENRKNLFHVIPLFR